MCRFLAFPATGFSGRVLEEGKTSTALKFSRNGRAGREGKRVPGGTGRQEGVLAQALGQRTAGKRSGHHVRTQQTLPITHGLFIPSLMCVLVSEMNWLVYRV